MSASGTTSGIMNNPHVRCGTMEPGLIGYWPLNGDTNARA